MTTSDWIAGAALVISLGTALRQWWFERRQAHLTELQIAEHEERAEKKAKERESDEFGRLHLEALKEYGRVRKPEPEG